MARVLELAISEKYDRPQASATPNSRAQAPQVWHRSAKLCKLWHVNAKRRISGPSIIQYHPLAHPPVRLASCH